MYRTLAVFFCLSVAGLTQSMPGPIVQNPFSLFPPALKDYLALTDAQVTSIESTNTDFNRYQAPRQARMIQVQLEIAQETAKSPLDPMALGLRYAEIEAIRREINEQLTKSRQTAVDVLTDAQKAKLKALDDAFKLQPVISEAQCENLLARPTAIAASAASAAILVSGTSSVQVISAVMGTGCAPVRAGNFSPTPVQP